MCTFCVLVTALLSVLPKSYHSTAFAVFFVLFAAGTRPGTHSSLEHSLDRLSSSASWHSTRHGGRGSGSNECVGTVQIGALLVVPKSAQCQIPPPSPPKGCIRREGISEADPAAGRQAVGGGCQSGWAAVTLGYKCH